MQRIELTSGGRGPVTTWVTGAVALAAVAAVLLVLTRPPPPRIAPPATAPASPGAAVLYVHVAGAVRNPGLYEVWPGARVADAIEAAGGPQPKALLDALNLAQLVVDGARIEVPLRAPAVSAAAPTVPAPGASVAGALISINSADQVALETIPGIGPVKAQAIIAYRDQAGGFSSLEQLLDVTGIGPATFETIRPFVTL